MLVHPSLFFDVCWRGLARSPQPGQVAAFACCFGGATMAPGKPCRACPACPALPSLPLPLGGSPGFNLLTAAGLWLAHNATAPAGEVGRSETGLQAQGPTGRQAAGRPKSWCDQEVAREASSTPGDASGGASGTLSCIMSHPCQIEP